MIVGALKIFADAEIAAFHALFAIEVVGALQICEAQFLLARKSLSAIFVFAALMANFGGDADRIFAFFGVCIAISVRFARDQICRDRLRGRLGMFPATNLNLIEIRN